jgi:hypothetical protein
MHLWTPQPVTDVRPFLAQRAPDPAAEAPPPALASPAPPLEQDPLAPAAVIERVAAASEARRAHFFRRAGDRYLEDEGDMEAALRCYTQALDSSKPEDLMISANDNWLLMALKKARLEENGHAKNGG